MKRHHYLQFFLFLILVFVSLQPVSLYPEQKSELVTRIETARGSEKRELVLQFLQKYSPEGYYIIHEYENCPHQFQFGRSTISFGTGFDFMSFINGNSIQKIVDDFNTAVHEMCHGFTMLCAYKYFEEHNTACPENGVSAFYVGNGKTIIVEHTPTFPSREMAGNIPEYLRTFRFNTYVGESDENQSTQAQGIYGLLDELNAYYHGTRSSVDFFDYFRTETRQNPEDWLEFFNSVNGTYYAHLEFKFYILKYLQYARENHPDIYQRIMNNQNFWLAFKNIDQNYTKLIHSYFNLKQAIYKKLTENGCTVAEDDEFLMIKRGSQGAGRGNFLKKYNLLKAELEKPEYQALLVYSFNLPQPPEEPVRDETVHQENREVKVALCQIFALDGDRSGNFARIENALFEARQNGAELACFPETCILGWVNSDAHLRAHPIPGPDSDRLCELARQYQIHVVIGLAEKEDRRLYDSVLLIDNSGKILHKHRKINILTSLMTPPYTPGTELAVVETKFGKIGLMICADTFKNELLRLMSEARPDLVIVPFGWAAPEEEWPEHGASLQETVTSAARTIGAPVIGTDLVGQITKGPWTGQVYGGQSVAVDSQGNLLAKGKDRERDIVLVTISLTHPVRDKW